MPDTKKSEADALVIGAGLAGLVATAELVAAGKHVIVLEKSPRRASAARPGGRSADSS